jgi:hypothetical protein
MIVDASRPNEQRSCIERDPHTTVVLDLYNAASILHHGQKSNVWICDAAAATRQTQTMARGSPSVTTSHFVSTDRQWCGLG